ncbi:hypothetical protein GCK32_018661, partial [Trichostrongylus colubriformis]
MKKTRQCMVSSRQLRCWCDYDLCNIPGVVLKMLKASVHARGVTQSEHEYCVMRAEKDFEKMKKKHFNFSQSEKPAPVTKVTAKSRSTIHSHIRKTVQHKTMKTYKENGTPKTT